MAKITNLPFDKKKGVQFNLDALPIRDIHIIFWLNMNRIKFSLVIYIFASEANINV